MKEGKLEINLSSSPTEGEHERVASCLFCPIGKEEHRGVWGILIPESQFPTGGFIPTPEQELRFRQHYEKPDKYAGYICGVNQRECSVLRAYKQSLHKHPFADRNHEHTSLKRFR